MNLIRSLIDRWRYDIWQTGMPRLCVLGIHRLSHPYGDCVRCGLGPQGVYGDWRDFGGGNYGE